MQTFLKDQSKVPNSIRAITLRPNLSEFVNFATYIQNIETKQNLSFVKVSKPAKIKNSKYLRIFEINQNFEMREKYILSTDGYKKYSDVLYNLYDINVNNNLNINFFMEQIDECN